MIRIVVADDVDLVLKGIQSILAGWSEGCMSSKEMGHKGQNVKRDSAQLYA
jgi:hypothetical protein